MPSDLTLSSLGQALALVGACAAIAACAPIYPVPDVQFPIATAPEMPASGPLAWTAQQPLPQGDVQAAPARSANGAIFQAASYRPMFEDYRARLVGDSLTIQITERVSASQTATSTIDKKSGINGSVTALPFVSPNAFSRGTVGANSENKFEGSGTTGSSNDFTGTITAIVTGVLPNGHLLVAGEKQIGLNHNVDTLRFTGQVDPRAIQPGNTILSTRVANVRVAHRGAGAMADTQGIGWLGRFFLNLSPV
jgi:flagellar L-ring protein precursor FlgH